MEMDDLLEEEEVVVVERARNRTCSNVLHQSRIKGRRGCRGCLWFIPQFHLHVWRSLDSELSHGLASEEEDDLLRGTKYAEMSSFIVWRKSNMFVSIPFLLLQTLAAVRAEFDLRQQLQQLEVVLGDAANGMINAANSVQGYLSIAVIFALFLNVWALYFWDDLRSSQLAIRRAWYLFYLSPFILSFIPWNLFLDADATVIWSIGGPTSQDWVVPARTLAGGYFSLRLLGELLPRTLALSVSVVRGVLNVRSLQTQSQIPGYMCLFLLIIVSPLMWLTFSPAVQLSGSLLVLFGAMLCCFAPVIFWFTRNQILPPMSNEEAHRKSFKIRLVYLLCLAAGIVLLVVFIASVRIGNELLQSLFTLPSIASGIIAFLSEYFLTNVFVCDVLVSMIADGGEYERTMDENVKRVNLERLESIRKLYY